MSNNYETFRESIVATLMASVQTTNVDGSRVSYDWSIAKAFRNCGEACKFADVNVLPDEFKKIVRFEFNKMKDSVLSNDGFELVRSVESPVLVSDGVAIMRTDKSRKTAVAMDEQLVLAIAMLGSVTNKLSTATQEKAVSLKKRAKAIQLRIDYLRAEIGRQEELVKIANTALNTSDSEVKIETATVK